MTQCLFLASQIELNQQLISVIIRKTQIKCVAQCRSADAKKVHKYILYKILNTSYLSLHYSKAEGHIRFIGQVMHS